MYFITNQNNTLRLVFTLFLGLSLSLLSGQWAEENVLTGQDVNGYFGSSVALSADGNRMIVGTPFSSASSAVAAAGRARIYRRVGPNWALSNSILSGNQLRDQGGAAVAISSDGKRVAFSARLDDNANGTDAGMISVYRLVPESETWVRVGNPILGIRYLDHAGYKIALNGDGTMLAVSSIVDDNQTGRVTIYRNTSDQGDWTQHRVAIRGTETSEQLGRSLSFSEENDFLAVGSSFHRRASRNGFVRVFSDLNGAWRLRGSEISNSARGFGDATDISKDGDFLIVGAEDDSSAWVYWFINGEWVLQGGRIPGPFNSAFGSSVGISADGKTIAVGADKAFVGQSSLTGEVYTYDLVDGAWVQRGEELKGTHGSERFGDALSLSHDGRKLIVGSSFRENSNTKGRVYYYEYTPPIVPPANDQPCDAIALPVNGIPQTGFSNVNAVLEPLESIIQPNDNGLRASVWFTFRAPASGTVTATTCGSTDFDTELAIYRAANCNDYSSYVLLGYNDDGEELCPVRTQSYLTVSDLTPGAQYFLVVDGYNQPEVDNSRGNFEITLEETLPACDNPAIAFDGVDDHIDIGPNQGNFGTNDFTFEVMVKTSQTVDSPANSHIPLASKREGCNCDKNFWYLTLDPGGKTRMTLIPDDCEQGLALLSETIINDDNWHHLVITREGNTYTLYVDGTRESFRDFRESDINLANAASLQLGASGCTEAGFGGIYNGQMDEVRTWNYARSAEEINDSRNREVNGNEEGLTAYYNFNDGRPGDDNTDRIGSIDLTGSPSVARLIAFDRNGTNSNWVAGNTGIRQLDRDEDGLYDACNEPDDLPTATRFEELPGVHLGQNYPNPTAGEVAIPIKLGGQHGAVELRFTSVMGKTVKVHSVPRGTDQDVRVEVSDLPVGIYFYSLFVGDRLAGTKRMVIAR